MADEEAEYTFDENAAKRIVRATKAHENRSPDRTPERRAGGASPNRKRLVEFTEDLEPDGTAKAKLLRRTGPGAWEAVDPEVEYTIEDAMGDRAKAGDRAWVEFLGGFWYVARLRASDCVRSIGGVPFEDIAGYVAGDRQFFSREPIVEGEGGCGEWVSASDEECPNDEE